METVVAVHEVDDVDHWLASPKRAEFFGEHGMSVRTSVIRMVRTRVCLIIETPDMETLKTALGGEDAAQAMKHDRVRPETLLMLVEG